MLLSIESIIGFLLPDLPSESILKYEARDVDNHTTDTEDKFIIKQLQNEISRLKAKKCPHCMFNKVSLKYPTMYNYW